MSLGGCWRNISISFIHEMKEIFKGAAGGNRPSCARVRLIGKAS